MVSRVAVIGAGIAGLAAAWELSTAESINVDLAVTVLEAAPTVGGKLRLAEVAGVPIDVGAESVLARRPEAVALMHELGLDDRIRHPAAVSASIVSSGRRWPLPSGTLMGVPSDPESVRGLLTDAEMERLVAERLSTLAASDVSVGGLVDERLGRAVTDKLVEPLLAGVYAGHARLISAEMAVPALARAARDGRSLTELARATAAEPTGGTPVFASLDGGLGTLPRVLAGAVHGRGVEVRTATTVRDISRVGTSWVVSCGPTNNERREAFDAVVVAVPAAPAARLLADIAPRASAALADIEHASVAIVTIALSGPPHAVLEGSGFLVPPTEPLTIKASTFSTVKWPWLARSQPGLTFLRASVGRHGEAAALQRTDAELVDVVLTDLAAVLGRPLPDPVDTHVQRWGGGLPQYAVGHRSRMAATTHLPYGIELCGAAYEGVGVPACIGSGRRAARAVLADLGLLPPPEPASATRGRV